MKLLPALKQKKRYVVLEIVSDTNFTLAEIRKEVDNALLLFLGQLGLSKAVPLFIKAKNNKFIMKVNHKWVDELKSALILIKRIKNKSVIVKSIITSGTLKKASTHL
tara:strand:- start:57 stop:377 length:321 start_codon:yes stop_codon:yes gene_type:complete